MFFLKIMFSNPNWRSIFTSTVLYSGKFEKVRVRLDPTLNPGSVYFELYDLGKLFKPLYPQSSSL